MTPTEFVAWVGGLTGLLMGLAKVFAYLLESLGLRPSDRRADRVHQLQELEAKVARLKQELTECEARVDELERELRAERRSVDLLERMLTRRGWTKGANGWEPEEGTKP